MQLGTQVLVHCDPPVTARPHFRQTVGDSGPVPSLLPRLSSGSFINCLPSSLGRGTRWGMQQGLPRSPGLCLPPAVTRSCTAALSWGKAGVKLPCPGG